MSVGNTYSRVKDLKHFIVLSNLSFPLFFLLLTPACPGCHSVRWKLGVRKTFRSMSSGVRESAGSLPWYHSSNEAFHLNINGLLQKPALSVAGERLHDLPPQWCDATSQAGLALKVLSLLFSTSLGLNFMENFWGWWGKCGAGEGPSHGLCLFFLA